MWRIDTLDWMYVVRSLTRAVVVIVPRTVYDRGVS